MEKFENEPNHGLAFDFSPDWPKVHALCLRSDGGDFNEALAIIDAMGGMPTVVPERARCLSACGIIFLGGQYRWSNSSGGGITPFRVMHVTAQLGFHAPYFAAQFPRVVPFEIAEQAFRSALGILIELNTRLARITSFEATESFPRDLLIRMLSTFGQNNFYYIDTVGKAGQYDIRLAGVPTIQLDDFSLFRLCGNAVTWGLGRVQGPFEPDLPSWNYEAVLPRAQGVVRSIIPVEITMISREDIIRNPQRFFRQVLSRHNECTIYRHVGPGDDYSVYYRYAEGTQAIRYRPMEPWHSLPHYVRLVEIAQSPSPAHLVQAESYYTSESNGRRFERILVGSSVVFREKYGSDGSEQLNLEAIYFSPDSTAKFYWSGGRQSSFRYEVSAAQRICFTPTAGQDRAFCGSLRRGEYGEIEWDTNLPTLGSRSVHFMRRGDVGDALSSTPEQAR
jgi:hypothetical protein